MTKQVFSTRQWLVAGAALFLFAACQPKEAAPSNSPKATSVDGSCKPAPQECVKECPCPAECPKKECPCPTECPKKECPCPTECCEVEVKKEAEPVVTQTEVRAEVQSEQTLSATAVVETPAS